MSYFRSFLAACLFVIVPFTGAVAQCVSPISSFPFTEDFESSNGGWTVGGNAPDWAWGAPAKSLISAAGQGSKCWVAGNLSGNTYNSNELAWIQSPCFNISSLTNPRVSFLVFWDSEYSFDGALLEYSTDGGTNWIVLGDQNSNSNCLGSNWYNHPSVRYLNNFKPGWSGSVSNNCGSINGSGNWRQAFHSLSVAAGSTQLKFRFLFGAGSICNDYNGFAIDQFRIEESPPPGSVDFTAACAGTNRGLFINQSRLCRASVAWDFGDPASGTSNTASGDTANHVFSGPGTYQVSMTVTFNNGLTANQVKPFTVLAATAVVLSPISCRGSSDGSIQATPSGSTGTVFLSWNTNPAQSTPVVTGLPAGTYTVNVSALNACPANASVTLDNPDTITAGASVQDEVCNNGSGSIILQPSGGTAPYAYNWNTGSNAASLTGLTAGNYSVAITDANGCGFNSGNIIVGNTSNTVAVSLGSDKVICTGESVVLDPGPYASYLWQDGSVFRTYTATATGRYEVRVTDNQGCTGSAAVNVTADCSEIYFPTAFTPNGDGQNETFGALGNTSAVGFYRLSVYNRLGQKVFFTTDVLKKWNGNIGGKPVDPQGFVWMAEYSIFGNPVVFKKGSLILIK